ncbi:MAG: lytic murein transglycosylase B [Pseudomonadota bacterium]
MRQGPVRKLLSLGSCLFVFTLAACTSSPPKSSDSTDSAGNQETAAADPRVAAPPSPPRPPLPAYKATRLTGDYADYASLQRLITQLGTEGQFEREYLYGLFSRVERQQWILDYLNRPKRKSKKPVPGGWTRYRKRFITENHIQRGMRFWHDYLPELERAYGRFGVAPEYIVAIIGVETHYGANVGRHRVIEALSTLAFDYPRREAFFREQLVDFLVMSRDEGIDPLEPVGSYAGAMGLGQFMPSSFHQFAVDFDGDGVRDLWNPVDAVGSVANYFHAHGWQTDAPVAVPARARGRAPHSLEAGFSSRYSIDNLAHQGIAPLTRIDGDADVSLLRLHAARGREYWVGLNNFYVITRYNHSTYYAMAVHQLAEALRDRYRRQAPVRLSQAGGAAGTPIL